MDGIDHTGVVIRVSRGDIEIAQHTPPKKDGLYDWQDGGHKVNGISMTHVWIVEPR